LCDGQRSTSEVNARIAAFSGEAMSGVEAIVQVLTRESILSLVRG
jgi:hypothetical protein